MEDQRFDELARVLLNAFLERWPDRASALGLREYDGRLPDPSPTALRRELVHWRALREDFLAVPEGGLTRSRPLDRLVALHLLDAWIFQGEELRLPLRIPIAPAVLREQLVALARGAWVEPVQAWGPLGRCLVQVPEFMGASREILGEPLAPAVEEGLEILRRLDAFLGDLRAFGLGGNPAPPSVLGELGAARGALKDHSRWLREEVLPRSTDGLAGARESLRRLLKLRGFGEDPEEMEALGRRRLKAAQERLLSLSGASKAARYGTAVSTLAQSAPTPSAEAARGEVTRARSFVQDRRLATLPPKDEVVLVDTPPHLQPLLPALACLDAGRWERGGRAVCFAPNDPGPLVGTLQMEVCREVYPGRHLQRACGNLSPSLLRPMLPWAGPSETLEGWALYSGQAMLEGGFHSESEFAIAEALADARAALDLLVDVGYLAGHLGRTEAVGLMATEGFMSPEEAVARVVHLLANPGLGLSATVGKVLILDLRREVAGRMGDRFSLAFFHDSLLYAGALPMFLMRKAMEDKLSAMEEAVEGG